MSNTSDALEPYAHLIYGSNPGWSEWTPSYEMSGELNGLCDIWRKRMRDYESKWDYYPRSYVSLLHIELDMRFPYRDRKESLHSWMICYRQFKNDCELHRPDIYVWLDEVEPVFQMNPEKIFNWLGPDKKIYCHGRGNCNCTCGSCAYGTHHAEMFYVKLRGIMGLSWAEIQHRALLSRSTPEQYVRYWETKGCVMDPHYGNPVAPPMWAQKRS